MAYTLTLNIGERKAIDWVGARYDHGHAFGDLLYACEWQVSEELSTLEIDWLTDTDITFKISEPLAWEIRDLLEDCLFDCFSDELVAKIQHLLESIV